MRARLSGSATSPTSSTVFAVLLGTVFAILVGVVAVALALPAGGVAVAVAVDLPPGGSFIDDDGNIHEGNIEAIAAEGITHGCNPPTNDRYCPGRVVTRGEMAAFLTRALGLTVRANDPFRDDDDSIFEADIDKIAAAGITKGCNPPKNDRFCPDATVTRGQMAAFLTRGFGYTDRGKGNWFKDDKGSIFEADIDKIAAAGITKGCNPPRNDRYCPKHKVTRDQMASFLARALHLTPITPPPPTTTTMPPTTEPPTTTTTPPTPTTEPPTPTTEPPTPTTMPPPPGGQPGAPIRAAFLYPWFPKAWTQSGMFPFTQYTPSLGFYDSADPAIIDQEMALAKQARLEAFISSWWGRGHHTDTALAAIMDRIPHSPHPEMKMAVYYEEEGQSDPSVATIVSDLEYLRDRYFSNSAYLRVDGKPVVFVWATTDGAGMAQRWRAAKAAFGGNLHVVLKVYSGWRDDPNQPDSWHQYGPSTAYHQHLPHSVNVSPGFWHATEATPRLARDPARFQSDVDRMNTSGAFWHLITSWNEWGEGTSIEPADEYDTTYINILAGGSPPPATTTTTTTTTTTKPPSGGSVRFVAAGDIGGRDDRAGDVFRSMVTQNSDFFLLLGDHSYDEITPESAWCSWIKGYFPAGYPIEVIVGNHEEQGGPDGYIRNFTPCIPDRMGAVGDYGVQYYFDTGPVRVIMIAADLTVDGVTYRYDRAGAHRDWLLARIDEAETAGRWTVIGMHKVCVTAGNKSCEIGEALIDEAISHGADLILHGHDHDYQRSHQLRCVDEDTTTPACIADSDSAHQAEDGAVIVITGWVGRSGTNVSTTDSEAGYYNVIAGPNTPGWTRGYLTVTATNTTLTGTWTSAQGGNTDTFTIQR